MNAKYRVSNDSDILNDFATKKEAVAYLTQYNQARWGDQRQFSNEGGFYISKLGIDGWEKVK
jgi:hypothetical protein